MIQKAGLITYLPFQEMLLRRSIFDVLCDFWYLPRIMKYLKMLVYPLFFDVDPEKVVELFDELDPAIQKVIMTKGLINLLPDNKRKLFLSETNKKSMTKPRMQTMNHLRKQFISFKQSINSLQHHESAILHSISDPHIIDLDENALFQKKGRSHSPKTIFLGDKSTH